MTQRNEQADGHDADWGRSSFTIRDTIRDFTPTTLERPKELYCDGANCGVVFERESEIPVVTEQGYFCSRQCEGSV